MDLIKLGKETFFNNIQKRYVNSLLQLRTHQIGKLPNAAVEQEFGLPPNVLSK